MRWIPILLTVVLIGCGPTVNVKVEPIHATVDVNVKIDRELDNFFDYRNQTGAGPVHLPAQADALVEG